MMAVAFYVAGAVGYFALAASEGQPWWRCVCISALWPLWFALLCVVMVGAALVLCFQRIRGGREEGR